MLATLEAPEIKQDPAIEDDTLLDELYLRFEHGDKLSHDEKDELIRLLFRKVKESRWQADDGITRVGKHEATRLWLVCHGIIRRAKRLGLMGLHWDKRQAAMHPLADEDAAIFMEFITEYKGSETKFSHDLWKRVCYRLNSEKQTTLRRAKRECSISSPAVAIGKRTDRHNPRLERLRSRIAEEVERLPPLQRHVIEQGLNNVPVSEIAARRNVTPQAIYELISKAHRQLKPSLQPLWEEYQDILSTRRMHNSRPRRFRSGSGEDSGA